HNSFFENPILINFFNPQATLPKPVLHIMGLLSPGGVHSHENHLFALLKLANQIKKTNPKHFSKLELHLFLDGRDTPPQSALESLNRLNRVIQSELNSPEWLSIRSVSGRFYAMDRDQRWERTDLVYKLLTQHETSYQFETAEQAILAAY